MKKLLAVAMLLTSGVAHSQNAVTTIAGLNGRCEAVSLAGVAAMCSQGSGLIYMALANGRVLFAFTLSDSRTVSFVAEKDSQPQPETYYLYLSRVRIVSKGSEFTSNIAGQCIVNMSRDGTIWSEVVCNATDANDAAYRLRFVSDGTPLDVEHPGTKR